MGGVSCASSTYCLATGTDSVTGIERPFALIWNGTAVRAAPQPPLPAGGSFPLPNGVSCVAVKSCLVGGDVFGRGGTLIVVDTWNGTKWTMHTLPTAKNMPVNVTAMSCVSLSHCVLGGQALAVTSFSLQPYLALWNGKTLTRMKSPAPAGFTAASIFGVSCVSAISCAATGDNIIDGASLKSTAYTETWNGKAWTATKFSWPATEPLSILQGVSCANTATVGTRCVAVGVAGTQDPGTPVAVSWNGKAWTATKVPALGPGKPAAFYGVSCRSAKQCIAIGSVGALNSPTVSPLAGFWNGSVWKLAAA
jgi:hypothetical protein